MYRLSLSYHDLSFSESVTVHFKLLNVVELSVQFFQWNIHCLKL